MQYFGLRFTFSPVSRQKLSKYADVFDFDVIELDSFSPQTFVTALHAAEGAGYDVFLCDSLSHFWTGRDGALEFVDMAEKRTRDNMGGWKEFRPHERLMVDEMVSSRCHVICTMRTKTDYQEQIGSDGKKKRVKIGLAPVQRDERPWSHLLIFALVFTSFGRLEQPLRPSTWFQTIMRGGQHRKVRANACIP
jgi:AAA domain